MKTFNGLRECADASVGVLRADRGVIYRTMLQCPTSYKPLRYPERGSGSKDVYRLRSQLVPMEGALSHVEGIVLYTLARTIGAQSIVELGTYAGHSTNYLAEAARYNGGRVDAVDLVRWWGGVLRGQAITLRNRMVVRQHKMDALKYLESRSDDSIDFIFEDTNHGWNNTYQLIMTGTRKLRSGGIMVVHDVAVTGVEGCDVDMAIESSGLDFHSFKVFPGEQGLAVWRKP